MHGLCILTVEEWMCISIKDVFEKKKKKKTEEEGVGGGWGTGQSTLLSRHEKVQ